MSHVHFILDEMAAVGHMQSIDDAIGLGRAYGIRLQFYFQSMGQLKTTFPNGQDQTLLSNTSQIFFGVNDNATADYVSQRLGEHTIVVDSGGTSWGTSTQNTQGIHPTSSRGRSGNSNSNWQQQARKLLKPEEVIALPPRTAITFTPGMAPISTTLLRYYEEFASSGKESRVARIWAAARALVFASVLCGAGVWLAFAFTQGMIRDVNSRSAATPPQRAGQMSSEHKE